MNAPLVLTASALENPPIDVVADAARRAGFDALERAIVPWRNG